jgi:hypothetical protein
VMPCGVIVEYQRFKVPSCLHLQEAAWTSETFYPTTTFHPEDGGSMDLWNVCILPE